MIACTTVDIECLFNFRALYSNINGIEFNGNGTRILLSNIYRPWDHWVNGLFEMPLSIDNGWTWNESERRRMESQRAASLEKTTSWLQHQLD